MVAVSLSPKGQQALTYLRRGWHPLPLCYTHEGRCVCGKDHDDSQAGKAPLTYWKARKRVTEAQVMRWWTRHPDANVAVLLHLSGLLVVDIDSDEAVEEIREKRWPRSLTVKTRKGYHVYFTRPLDCPKGRRTQRGESQAIDVLSTGYVVAPPSVSPSGHVYQWLTDPASEPLTAPDWPVEILEQGYKAESHRPAWKAPRMQRRRCSDGEFRTFTNPHNTREEWLKSALSYINAEDYDMWLHIGMALKQWDDKGNGHGRGFALWDEWSSASSKYPGRRKLQAKWRSFGRRGGVNLATLFAHAKRAGFSYDSPCRVQVVKRVGGWKKA